MYINIDLNELAAEITRKIRDEMGKVRVVDFGEVKNVSKLDNGGWTAQVLLPGAETLTNPLNCLQNYVPNIGDWVMIIYPPKSEPVLVDCTPMRENEIRTPEDKFAVEGDVPDHDHDSRYYTKTLSDEKYAAATHDHDGRYYTKTISDQRYAPINHTHEGMIGADHNHDDRYYTEDESDLRYAAAEHSHDYTGAWIWTDALPLNGWATTSTGHTPPGYAEDIQGVLHLRGRVTGGILGESIMQLPSGPEFIETRIGSSNNAAAVIEIHPDGSVIPVSGDPASWISLDGISIKL
jgi:hypothetical protein